MPDEIYHLLSKQKGKFILLTGLPSAGKTFVGDWIAKEFHYRDYIVQHLDGDKFRLNISKGLDFTRDGRIENMKRLAKIGKQLVNQNIIAIASFIAPYKEARDIFRKEFDKDYIEVYIKTERRVCIERDPKGLWKKALRGEIKNFTGVDDVYEVPEYPDYTIENSGNNNSGLFVNIKNLVNQILEK